MLQRVGRDLDTTTRALAIATRSMHDSAGVLRARESYEVLRRAYKHLEPFAEYLDPEYVSLWVNGAPLPRIDPKSQFVDVVNPVGFQAIDELLHADVDDVRDSAQRIITLVEDLRIHLRELTAEVRSVRITDRMLIEIARTATIRVTTMGITGFDRPASDLDLAENIITMDVISGIANVFAEQCREANVDAAQRVAMLAEAGKNIFRAATDADAFDRAHVIRSCLDPLYGALLDIQIGLGIELASEISPLPTPVNPIGRTMFGPTTLDPLAGTGLPRRLLTPASIELGRSLFFDPVLSAANDRACASCHRPERGFADGLPKSVAIGHTTSIDRHAPTLLDAVFARRFFTDLRASRLDDVIEHVISNSREFGASVSMVIERLRQSDEYLAMFRRAFPTVDGDGVNISNIGRAMAAYLSTLTTMNSPVDRYLRGEDVVMDPAVRRGFNLFMGRAACATCHFPPTFAGYVPPMFLSSESEILGVPVVADTANAALDPDIGRAGGILREQVGIYRNSFKTPTVRNVTITAPYMHNGVYTSLHDVLKFYDLGGGAGIGIDHPYQTLAADRLDFSARDYDDLIAFMQALTDTSGTTTRPRRLPRMLDPVLQERVVGGTY